MSLGNNARAGFGRPAATPACKASSTLHVLECPRGYGDRLNQSSRWLLMANTKTV